MENNKNNIEKNKTVECRFYDEEAFLSEEGIKKVLKDTYKFELNNLELKVVDSNVDESKIEEAFLKGICNFEKDKAENFQSENDEDKKFESVTRDGRISINISLSKNYVQIISLASEFIKILTTIVRSQDVTTEDSLKNITDATQFIFNSFHINRGIELCVVKIFNEIYTHPEKNHYINKNNNYIPLEIIKEYINKNIVGEKDIAKKEVKHGSAAQEIKCPFNKVCKNSSKCGLKRYNDEHLYVIDEDNLQEILKSLESHNVIEKNNGESEYRIKPLISF